MEKDEKDTLPDNNQREARPDILTQDKIRFQVKRNISFQDLIYVRASVSVSAQAGGTGKNRLL